MPRGGSGVNGSPRWEPKAHIFGFANGPANRYVDCRVGIEAVGVRIDERARSQEENIMADRQQETSVMVSIQEILQDAQNREVEEKAEAERRAREQEQRRLAEVKARQEAEAARIRAEEDERQRRDFEEQKRQAELRAVQEAALQKVKMEAESQARLAEIESRQEHERQLHALSQDKHKKRLTMIAAALGAVFFFGAIGAGVVISNISAGKARAEARARDLESQKDQIEQQQASLRAKLDQGYGPGDDCGTPGAARGQPQEASGHQTAAARHSTGHRGWGRGATAGSGQAGGRSCEGAVQLSAGQSPLHVPLIDEGGASRPPSSSPSTRGVLCGSPRAPHRRGACFAAPLELPHRRGACFAAALELPHRRGACFAAALELPHRRGACFAAPLELPQDRLSPGEDGRLPTADGPPRTALSPRLRRR